MKIKATCQIIDIKTDAVTSERVIGEFDTQDAASFAAHRERKENEVVALYGLPQDEEEEMSALEMAEIATEWEEYAKL